VTGSIDQSIRYWDLPSRTNDVTLVGTSSVRSVRGQGMMFT
jgi:hypothetical protein